MTGFVIKLTTNTMTTTFTTEINIESEVERLNSGWRLSEDRRKISKEFRLPDFLPALDFVRMVGEDAEKRDHHPDIHVYVRKVVFDLTTFDAGQRLTNLDFESARAIDEIFKKEFNPAPKLA